MKKGLLNGTFFNFLFGFMFMLSISLSVVLAVNYYDITTEDLMQAGVSFVLFK